MKITYNLKKLNMDIEELINNINNYDEITKSFYDNYLKNKNITFDKLLKDTLKNKSFKLNLNKIILRKSFLNLVQKDIFKLDKEFLKLLIKSIDRSRGNGVPFFKEILGTENFKR